MTPVSRLSAAHLTCRVYPDYPLFRPYGSPRFLLELGIFDGHYFDDDPSCIPEGCTPHSANFFAPCVSRPRADWIANGWITPHDPLGWFQWFTRFHEGRRLEDDTDRWQIARWSSFGARHGAQVRMYGGQSLTVRLRQRQSLLHWAHDPIPDFITTAGESS